MAINAGQVFVELGARLDRREFQQYEKHLKDVREQVANKERFKAQLGGDFDPRAFRAYEREMKQAHKGVEDNIKAQGRLRTSFGAVYGRGGALFAAAGGLTAFAAVGKTAIDTASDINESLGKNRVLFGEFSKDVEKFSKTSASSFGISRKAALEYTGTFGNLFNALGVARDRSADFSVELTKLGADMASFNNTSIEEALEAIRSGLSGETEPLRKFGVFLSETAIKAEALSAGMVKAAVDTDKIKAAQLGAEVAQRKYNDAIREHGKGSDEAKTAHIGLINAQVRVKKATAGTNVDLDAQTKALAAQRIIVRQTGAAHGDFARTSGGLANQTRILKARFSDISGEIGGKLLPAVLKGATGLNKFIDGMRNGRGVGGQFAAVLRGLGRAAQRFGDDFNSNERQVGGWISGLGRAESTALKFTGALVGGRVGRQLQEWGRNVDRNSDSIDRWRQKLRVTREVDKIGDDIDRLRRRTRGGLRDIERDTDRNMDRIRRHMTVESAAGQRALARNFDAATRSIRRAMRDGRVSTADGLTAIRRLMLRELRTLGISTAQREGRPLEASPGITNAQDSGTPLSPNPPRRYMGGWMGQRGEVGQDTIPALLAPGEAVLNRHQQAVVEELLGEGFLDRLFSTVNRPHFMQRGGRARFQIGGAAGAQRSGGRLQLPESFSPTHQTAGLAGYPAVDVFAAPGTSVGSPVSGTVARLSGQAGGPGGGGAYGYSIYINGSNGRSYYLTHFGSTNVRGGQSVTRGQNIGTVADYPGGVPDHIHEGVHGGLTGIVSGGGPMGGVPVAVWNAIKAPRTGMTGALGDVVQGTLNRATRLANARGRELAEQAAPPGSVATHRGGEISAGGRFDRSALAALWRRAGGPANVATLMAAIALAESGGDPNAHNPSGATGLWQILGNPFPGNARDPLTNARMAVSKYQSQGLGAWEAYTRGMHKRFMNRGGFLGLATGGPGHYDPRSRHTSAGLVPFVIPGFGTVYLTQAEARRQRARIKAMRKRQHPNWPGQREVQFNSRGGFIQRFQGGGFAGRPGPSWGGGSARRIGPSWDSGVGGGTTISIRGLRGLQGDRIDDLEAEEANIEGWREQYSRQDRRYSLSDEILIDETTGAVNEGNVRKRANELLKLLAIRAKILAHLRKMRRILQRVVQTYRTIIGRLTRSLRHAKKKERSSIRKQIAHYQAQLGNRRGQLKDLAGDIYDAETDVMEIRAERKEVLGTTAEIRTPDTDLGGGDVGGGGGDIGGDTGAADTTTEAPPTPLQIAEAAAQEMRTFLAGRQELLTSFGRNFVPAGQAGATFGSPDALTSAAGLRAFGGAGTAGGMGGATVIANFASAPGNAPTFVEQVRFLVGG